ncbi:ABC transporter ATP-binding protein [Marinobacterium rhizophilum]|uniref:ABC transporter ATP-binding protein n=1 Tax=Marinobacterium rhizophilum TaxID=420402 RepID=UPI0004757F43|nr:ATP-binding cassette domain-containing protein [Marinobacterium rhizophilum]
MLKLQSVCSDVAGINVLRNVTGEVHAGSLTAVIGRNGAGKTTLLRTIMGAVEIKHGTIHVDGELINHLKAYERSHIGIGWAPEERVIFPTMSVKENMMFPCQIVGHNKGQVQDRIDMVLDVVPQLKAMLDRSGAALSGGQGKMVALGRALMVGTRIVLLDEPFQGLSPALAREYGESLSNLRNSQPDIAIIVTESNAALLHGIADQTFNIERGEITN